jgi:uncharacterized membrane protein HdeD (DUF308 family)
MDFTSQELIGGIAFLLGFIGHSFYVVSILQNKTKPHLYTWLIWGILTGIAYAAQVYDNAGPGSWQMGISAFLCLMTAVMALKWGEKDITRGDKIALIASLSAIVPWLLTKDPLGSVILISIIDVVAFYPTFRKSWLKPQEENLTTYNLANLKLTLSLFALNNVSLTTALYPAVVVGINTIFVIMCLIRRKQIAAAQTS